MVPYEYIRRTYGVDPVSGHRVHHHVTKREGTIQPYAGGGSAYVHVCFDGDNHAVPCHPTEMDYLGAPDDDDPINLARSGPVQIVQRGKT